MGNIISKILLGATTFFSGYITNDVVETPQTSNSGETLDLTKITGYTILAGTAYYAFRKYIK